MKRAISFQLSAISKDISLLLLSGFLLTWSFPAFNLEFLAFVAFVPLFFALKDKNLKQAFFLSYLTGIVFWLGTIYWLIHVTLPGLILLVLYLSLYFGLFGVCFRLLNFSTFKLLTIALPAVWVFLEWLRSTLITGFPWALLGYSQYLNSPFIQIADIAGVWGVSFLVMMVNVAIYQLIAHSSKPIGKKQKTIFIRINYVFPIILILLTLIYGYYKLSLRPPPYALHPIRISLIQGNIPQHQKWDASLKDHIMERYEMLTKEAAKDRPDLIIWPETSVPGVIGEDQGLLDSITRLARSVKIPLLAGAVTSRAISHQPSAISYYNSAVLISEDGKIIQQYDKLHLVPFGEYIPLERYLPFLRKAIGVPVGDFVAGKEYTVFKTQVTRSPSHQVTRISGYKTEGKFAVLICFEDTIPALSRRFVKEGAQFLVNITNDAWFLPGSAPYQHVQASVFRAIENRVPVVRAANTGVSCFIDRNGKIYDKVTVDNKGVFVLGYKTSEVAVKVNSWDNFRGGRGKLSP